MSTDTQGNRRARKMASQRRALTRRYKSSSQYLRTVEALVAEHPGDAFYAHQLKTQREEVTRIGRALEYVGGSTQAASSSGT